MNNIKGTGVALVTPFKKELSIDYDALERLINHVTSGGVNYLVIMGTTGESAVLSDDEKDKVLNFCIEINNNRLPIVLGIGGNNTMNLVQSISNLDNNLVDAILSVSPYYNRPSQEGIYNHYKSIAESTKKPIILYNVPSRTGSNIESSTTLKLAHNFSNIIAIKEASGDMYQIMNIIKDKPNDFMVISGDDALTNQMIFMGASGVISVIGQSHPTEYSKMVKEALAGNIGLANSIHYKLFNFYNPLYSEGNPVGIKALLSLLDICDLHVRPPLVNASKKILAELDMLL
tara:strand:+ start:180 stop:1046 length:867 start_codon:yes stop_codon:yes gene_type:complete